jgi:hypothetical protein
MRDLPHLVLALAMLIAAVMPAGRNRSRSRG